MGHFNSFCVSSRFAARLLHKICECLALKDLVGSFSKMKASNQLPVGLSESSCQCATKQSLAMEISGSSKLTDCNRDLIFCWELGEPSPAPHRVSSQALRARNPEDSEKSPERVSPAPGTLWGLFRASGPKGGGADPKSSHFRKRQKTRKSRVQEISRDAQIGNGSFPPWKEGSPNSDNFWVFCRFLIILFRRGA